jgi:hypothetical protein
MAYSLWLTAYSLWLPFPLPIALFIIMYCKQITLPHTPFSLTIKGLALTYASSRKMTGFELIFVKHFYFSY